MQCRLHPTAFFEITNSPQSAQPQALTHHHTHFPQNKRNLERVFLER